jgi:hypothetical protein
MYEWLALRFGISGTPVRTLGGLGANRIQNSNARRTSARDAPLSGASVEILGRAVPEQGCYFVPLVLAWSGFLTPFAESLKIGFAVRIEGVPAALLPRSFKFGRCDVPVGPAFAADST